MAPPLVKGRALARRRLAGIAFLVVLALLVQLAVWMYQKKFTDVVRVELKTDTIGNQLSVHSDVKMRGVLIGEVRKVTSNGQVATLELALDPGKAKQVPEDVHAQLLPKTLFGEKQVVLVAPDDEGTTFPHLKNGDVISQDRSTTALETETALNDLLPLLKSLRPQELSTFLDNLSTSVRGRGNALGTNLADAAAYLKQINPKLPLAGSDLQGLADLTNNIAVSSPDLLRELDNLAASSRNLQQERGSLDAWLQSTSDFASSTRSLVKDNEQRLIALAKDSTAPAQLFARYSNFYPCFLNRLAFQETEGERVFGGGQPGLHITIEATKDHGGYVQGDEPQNKEARDFGCFGLGAKPVVPMPDYANPQDGYRDSAPPEDPGKGPNGCCQSAASWEPAVTSSPKADLVATEPMPAGTTELDALMLAPVVGTS